MKEVFRVAKLIGVLVLVLGVAYPLVTLLAARALPGTADGGIVYRGGRAVGARNIGQEFTSGGLFHGRPSAAGEGYDAMASGGSNLGPTNPVLRREIEARVRKLLGENPGLERSEIPVELVTASASGLDPDISVQSATMQVERVSRATGVSPAALKKMIEENTGGRVLWIFGEPRVNVLELNLDVLEAGKGDGS